MRKLITLFAALIMVLMWVTPVKAQESVDSVANQLICQCGCFMVLNNCTHQECSSRETMLGIIKQKLSEGQSGETIIASFVRQYGEVVLSEPPKRGFNLTAWITPFGAILAGGVVIFLAVKRWLKQGAPHTAEATVYPEQDNEYRERIERELKKFPEKGFR